MSSIHVEGNAPEELDRRAYDLRRSADAVGAVCHAPILSLALRADGKVTPCRYSDVVLGDMRRSSLEVIWGGTKADELRSRFQDYRIPGEECRACVECLREGVYFASHARREFDPLKERSRTEPEAPRQLSMPVDLDLGKEPTRLLRAWLHGMDTFELILTSGSEAAEKQQAEALKEHLKSVAKIPAEQQPAVRLRCVGRIPKVPASKASLVRHVDVYLPLTGALGARPLKRLQRLVETLRPEGGEVALHVVVDRSNWFQLWALLHQTRGLGASVIPEPLAPGEDLSLARLDGDALAALHAVLYRWKKAYDPAEDDPAALQRWNVLLRRMRRWQSTAAEGTDRIRTFDLPDLGEPCMQDETESRCLLADFLRTYRREEVDGWLRRLVGHENFVEEARERLSLRVAALWSSGVFQNQAVHEVLRQVYGSRENAVAISERDLAELSGSAFEGWVKGWTDELNLGQLTKRRKAFRLTPQPPPAPDGKKTAVTVLIPSYNHAAYVGRAIESVLAQSEPRFHLHVVDDGSTDATVEVAMSFADPRMSVRQNPQNLGLGYSVHGALDAIETEWVAILNSDDLFHPERLERCLQAAARNPSAQVIATSLTAINQEEERCSAADSSPVFEGSKVYRWLQWYGDHRPSRIKPERLFGHLLESNFLVTSSNLFVRTEFLRRHAERWKSLEYCLDWQIFLQAAAEEALFYLTVPSLGYRLHDANTVWFDEEREWRYYVESNQVVARVLDLIFRSGETATAAPKKRKRVSGLLEALADHLPENSSVDGYGMLLGLYLEQMGLSARDIAQKDITRRIRSLHQRMKDKLDALHMYHQFGGDLTDLFRLRGERPFLEATRVTHEALADELARLHGDYLGALEDRTNLTRLWHQAEAERDQESAAKAPLYEEIGRLQGDRDRERFEKEEARRELDEATQRAEQLAAREQEWQERETERDRELARERQTREEIEANLIMANHTLNETREDLNATRAATEKIGAELQALRGELSTLRDQTEQLRTHLQQRTGERDRLRGSPEYRVGHLLLNRIGLRTPLRAFEVQSLALRQRASLARLALDGKAWPGRKQPSYRAMATICWNFPIYSQTFVYQELCQLMERGNFDLRVVYSKLEPRSHLASQFSPLWSRKRFQVLHRDVNRADYARYQARLPGKVEEILTLLSSHSGMSREDIEKHDNFLQAFTYARMVEAYRPDYLHSYFFYDRTLFTWIAAHLHDLPRGVSCYADHVMDDYEFKLVPLHMQTCDVVIATSHRIKDELLQIAPGTDPDKILVKPNAVDVRRFEVMERAEPEAGQPFRVVTTSRIEPKKGLVTLARAAALLRDRGVPVEFHLIGEADQGMQASQDYRDRLLREIESLGLWGVVHLEGRQDQGGVRRFLGLAHLFVAPFVETRTGDKDGIPTALLEGMATGLPAVCSDAGSMTEVVTPGVDGVIVPQRDPEALADTIERLLLDPGLRAGMARQAALKIRKEFDVSVCERRFHDRVQDILARRRQGAR